MPSPNLMAAALARRTSRAKLIVLGNSVALYDPPTRVAEEMAMIDVISGGRLVAGFPVGTPMDTAYCYGANPATLREKYREGVELIVRAWKERRPFTFNGKYTQLRYVNPWPTPIQTPRPPVWIPGGGSVEQWEWCIERLRLRLSHLFRLAGTAVIDGFWETVDRFWGGTQPLRGVRNSSASPRTMPRRRSSRRARAVVFTTAASTPSGFRGPPGCQRRHHRGRGSCVRDRRPRCRANCYPEGDPTCCGGGQSRHRRRPPRHGRPIVGHLMLCITATCRTTTLYNTTRFARDVMPKVPPINEWEDKWWPKQTPPISAGRRQRHCGRVERRHTPE